jgi:hypothetical protein
MTLFWRMKFWPRKTGNTSWEYMTWRRGSGRLKSNGICYKGRGKERICRGSRLKMKRRGRLRKWWRLFKDLRWKLLILRKISRCKKLRPRILSHRRLQMMKNLMRLGSKIKSCKLSSGFKRLLQ